VKYLAILLFLVGCNNLSERCVDSCVKQGKTVDSYHYDDTTNTGHCVCSEECSK